jgi:hypothetical protein
VQILTDPAQAKITAEKIKRMKGFKAAIDETVESMTKLVNVDRLESKKFDFSAPKSPLKLDDITNKKPKDKKETPLPVNAWGEEGGAMGVDEWGPKADAVISYANTAMNALGGLDAAMSAYENAQLAKDEAANNSKKLNLKRQFDAKLITQKQYDAAVNKLDADTDKKKRELTHKQAVRAKELSVVQAVINVAQGVTSALTAGPIIGVILAALVGVLGAIQIGYIMNAPIPAAAKGRYKALQAAMGRYDVIGQSDNKSYKGVPFIPNFDGISGTPVLTNETGKEIIINPEHTRNLMLNYPMIIDAIRTTAPQRATGSYPDSVFSSPGAGGSFMYSVDPEYLQALKDHTEALKKPSKSFVVWEDINQANKQMDQIFTDVR